MSLAEKGFERVAGVLSGPIITRAADLLEDRWPEPRRARARIALRHLQDRAAELIALLKPLITGVMRPRLGPGARIVRALAFDKRAAANWAVAWHQDRIIALAEARDHPALAAHGLKEGAPHALAPAAWLAPMLTLRLHLDPCDADTGALRLIPGSHRRGVLDPAAIRELGADEPFIAAASAGDALLMRPLTLHASSAIAGPGRRRVLHFECAPGPLPAPLRWYRPVFLDASAS